MKKILTQHLMYGAIVLHQIVCSYCEFGNFRENFIVAKSTKRHIFDTQNSRLRHDLSISVNNRVILLFR